MIFVIFCGNDHVGKTTMAESLYNLIIRGFRKIPDILSYADGVRQELIDQYGLPKDIVYNKKINKNEFVIRLNEFDYDKTIPKLWKKYGLISNINEFDKLEISLRDLFVNHGTKIRRQEDDLYWAKRLIVNEDRIISIIDDARSPSDFIVDKNPIIFHLINDNKPIENEEQNRMNDWIQHNQDKIRDTIHVSIPLIKFDADKLNQTKVIPHIRDFLT